jgi:hypothetical protein
MASGASLGYKNGTRYGSQTANVNRANDAAQTATRSNSSKDCTFVTQTFANKDCKASDATIGGVSASQYREKIISHYKGTAKRVLNYNSTKTYGERKYNTFSSGNLNDYAVNANGSTTADENSIVSYRIKDNVVLDSGSIVTDAKLEGQSNKTVVYDAADQDVVIDGDIIINTRNVSSPKDIAAVIIIAKNVYITSGPKRIDAIIVADKVNTCAFNGSTAIKMNNLGANVCNNSLQFNAPVLTKKLVLSRTAGAGKGEESSERAEIFNFSNTNYLWTYAQMTRFNQAVTTYSRELPPRY